MVNVTGIRFQNAGKLFYFASGELWPMPGDYAILETSHGQALGEVVTPVQEIDETTLPTPLQPLIRIATAADLEHHKENKVAEKEAYAVCQKKIIEHKLDMKLVSVEYTFDNSKVLFYFTANGRVDFRSLVKDLASVFRTRIELRQIGVRDEAKMIGGLGPCGRPICCAAFLGDFQPVSIKMAKEQNLSLNPIKISGVCGRLMCCLKYEQDTYEETRKRMPRVGKDVVTPDGIGNVLDVNVIRETVKVRVPKGDTFEVKDYPASQLQKPNAAHGADKADGAEIPHVHAPKHQHDSTANVQEQPVHSEALNQQMLVSSTTIESNEISNTPTKPQHKANSWKQALEQAKKAASSEDDQIITDTAEADINLQLD